MKIILYIGNHLSRNGGYPSVAESMAPLLEPEVRLHLVSRRKNQVLRLLDMLWAVLRYGRQEQPVVIDTYSTLNFYYALATGLLCRLLGIAYCCVLHGGNLPARLQKNPRWCRVLFGGTRENIAPSGYLQAAFQQAGYPTRLIPNFIPIKNYPFLQRHPLRPRLLWVRAFDATYNPGLAIRVLHQLSQHYPDAVLCMVGPDKDGSLATCQALAAELGVSNKVVFTGQLSKAAWIKLSEQYDIFINTTNFDNTPVSVIEAMSLGLPVVSTNVGGIPYLVEDGKSGLLVPKEDADAMCQAIKILLTNDMLASTLSMNARKKAEQFDWEVIQGKWLEIFK